MDRRLYSEKLHRKKTIPRRDYMERDYIGESGQYKVDNIRKKNRKERGLHKERSHRKGNYIETRLHREKII